jgi:hypothetical protein
MASTTSLELVVCVKFAAKDIVVFIVPFTSLTVARLIDDLLQSLGIPGNSSHWELRHHAVTLPPGNGIAAAISAAGLEIALGQSIHLQLLPRSSISEVDALLHAPDHATSLEPLAATAPAASDELAPACGNADLAAFSLEDSLEHGEGNDGELAPSIAADHEYRTDTIRRATVRYYSRMRPDRVYPLLVIVTNRFVETARMANATQRSSEKFTARDDVPIEIEPVLPGCDCYPPRIVTLLEPADTEFRFRIVPSAIGQLDGATIFIRQRHLVIARIDLDVRVTTGTSVAVSGILTFALPAMSTITEKVGLNFAQNPDTGVNAYLAAAHLLFDCLTPLGLTACLGSVTTALWWLCRPRVGDAFHDVETITPEEKLQRLSSRLASNAPGVRKELEEFIDAYPENFPARLMRARHSIQIGRDTDALEDFTKAFSLGPATAADCEIAYQLARKSGRPSDARRVLELAYSALDSDAMPPRLIYNLACFRALAGDENEAMQALSTAFTSGYPNIGRAMSDADLSALRHREDFQALIAKAMGASAR